MASSIGSLDTTSTSTPSATPLDTLDIDQYINYDPSPTDSAPCTPESTPAKSTSMPLRPNECFSDMLLPQPSQQTFAGPSHQYELHKQQTGLPLGALANTFAVNQSDHIVYGQAQRRFGISDGFFGSNTIDDGTFDFNTTPYRNPSTDMDIDFGSSIYDSNTDYIDPNAVGGQEAFGNSTSQKQRAWPGMHQQQAALAKAQAESQAQHQAQAQQQRQQAVASQQAIPAARHSSHQPAKDPIVEERISRLLNQMRHSSVGSSNVGSPGPNASAGNHHLGRAKKDEEDMDEDERLLASEEGKKLSSKERRQLRNKVSARAFRSRRKEYIGQLEGELAAKSTEADDLRAKNHELMAENSRLTDLTRMLLESPAFSSFLNEMSGVDGSNGTSSSSQQLAPAPKVEDAQPQASKDVNPHQASPYVQSDRSIPQIGTGLRPDTYSTFNTATTWTDNMESGLYDAQVYAVTSLPEGPVFDQFDTGLLSGKTSSSSSPFAWFDAKQDAPVLEQPPSPCEKANTLLPTSEDSGLNDAEMHESDPVFSLYDDTAPSRKSAPPENVAFSRIVAEKASERIVLTVTDESIENNQVSVATMKRFWQFCATMEDLSQRVASATSHLQ